MSELLDNGNKARQRKDEIDRSIPFSNALRSYGVPATDLDYVVTNGANTIRLILEVTCPDERVYSPAKYLGAIDARRRDQSRGNHNDDIIGAIAQKLGVRAILVVHESNVNSPGAVLWWRYIDGDVWYERDAVEFFERLRDFALGV